MHVWGIDYVTMGTFDVVDRKHMAHQQQWMIDNSNAFRWYMYVVVGRENVFKWCMLFAAETDYSLDNLSIRI